jgi:hypothetical protein
MKKIFALIFVVCLAICGYARHDVIYLCQGDTYSWNLSEYCTPSDTLVYASGPVDWTVFYQEAQYDTVLGNTVTLSPTVGRLYKLISINGSGTLIGDCPVYLTIHINTAPTISIDSIKHVTCPDGWDFPYADGEFHVSLEDSVQNYAWINIEIDTPFFWSYTSYDSVFLTSLRSGTYHVFSHGVNGCVYHDSVTIEQPDAWYSNPDSLYIDTVCIGQLGCNSISVCGGSPPYNFTWCYFEYTENGLDTIFLEDTTRMVCGLVGGGRLYHVFMYDSRGCKAYGEEIFSIFTYLYEWVEDSISLTATNPKICYGGVDTLHAQSIGEETNYIWHVGDLSDSTNYSTWIETDSVYIAEYLTPPMIESAWVSVDFYDQHNCVTHDSVWVEVYNPDVSMTIQTSEIFTDSTFVVYVSPPGGDLYIDDALLISSIPSVFTVYTDGISVGSHVLKYAGTFGGSMGLACDDEISIPIQVETNPFVPDWEYEISIYPNPATTTLNLTSAEMMNMIVSITDITGRVIQTEKVMDSFYVIDVSNLSSGIYLLRLESNDGASKSIKFVKR